MTDDAVRAVMPNLDATHLVELRRRIAAAVTDVDAIAVIDGNTWQAHLNSLSGATLERPGVISFAVYQDSDGPQKWVHQRTHYAHNPGGDPAGDDSWPEADAAIAARDAEVGAVAEFVRSRNIDPTAALLAIAEAFGIGVAYEDRGCLEIRYGRSFTEQEWETLASHVGGASLDDQIGNSGSTEIVGIWFDGAATRAELNNSECDECGYPAIIFASGVSNHLRPTRVGETCEDVGVAGYAIDYDQDGDHTALVLPLVP